MVFSDRLLDAIREEPTRYTQVSVLAPGLLPPLALGATAFKENG
jgi:hypothetical protein